MQPIIDHGRCVFHASIWLINTGEQLKAIIYLGPPVGLLVLIRAAVCWFETKPISRAQFEGHQPLSRSSDPSPPPSAETPSEARQPKSTVHLLQWIGIASAAVILFGTAWFVWVYVQRRSNADQAERSLAYAVESLAAREYPGCCSRLLAVYPAVMAGGRPDQAELWQKTATETLRRQALAIERLIETEQVVLAESALTSAEFQKLADLAGGGDWSEAQTRLRSAAAETRKRLEPIYQARLREFLVVAPKESVEAKVDQKAMTRGTRHGGMLSGCDSCDFTVRLANKSNLAILRVEMQGEVLLLIGGAYFAEPNRLKPQKHEVTRQLAVLLRRGASQNVTVTLDLNPPVQKIESFLAAVEVTKAVGLPLDREKALDYLSIVEKLRVLGASLPEDLETAANAYRSWLAEPN